MDDLGRVLIRMPARRVGSPFFLLLLVLMAAGAFGFAGLEIGLLCTAAIAVVAVGFGFLWNRGIRLATVHERGIVLKGGGRPRSITWDRIQRIDRRVHESAYARVTFFDVVASGPSADPVKVTLTPAAEGPELSGPEADGK